MSSPFLRRPPSGAWWEAYQQAIPRLASYQGLPDAVALLRKALSGCPDPVWRLWLWYRLAVTLMASGQRGEGVAAIESGRQDLAAFDRPLPLAEAWFYAGEAVGAQLAGEWELSVTLCQMGFGVLEAHAQGRPDEEIELQAQVRYELHRRLLQAQARRADVSSVLAHLYGTLDAARILGNRRYLGVVSVAFVEFLGRMGRMRLAWQMIEAQLQAFTPMTNGWAIAEWEMLLSDLYRVEGNLDVAAAHLQRALDGLARVDIPWPKPAITNRSAWMAELRGEVAQARALYGQALAEAESLGAVDQAAMANVGIVRGLIRAGGVSPEAAQRATKVLALCERSGSSMLRSRAIHLRYCLATHLGEWDEARRMRELSQANTRTFPGIRADLILQARDLGRPWADTAPAIFQQMHRADVRRTALPLLPTELWRSRRDSAERLEELGDWELAAQLRSTYVELHPDTQALEAAAQALAEQLLHLPLGDRPFYEYTAKEASQDVIEATRRT